MNGELSYKEQKRRQTATDRLYRVLNFLNGTFPWDDPFRLSLSLTVHNMIDDLEENNPSSFRYTPNE